MTRRLARLADIAYRRRGRMVLAWIVATVVLIGLGSNFAGEYEADYNTPGSESKEASELTEREFDGYSGQEIFVVWKDPSGATARPRKANVNDFFREAEAVENVEKREAIRVSDRRHDRDHDAAADDPRLGGAEGAGRKAGRRGRSQQRRRPPDRARRRTDLPRPGRRQPRGDRLPRRGDRAADRLRLAGRRRPAADHRPGRDRDLRRRADRPPRQRHRRPRLDPRRLRPDRDRRRDRLRAAGPDPLPLRAEVRQGPPRRRRRGGHHRRAQRHHRRRHRRHRRPRALPHRPALHVRGRDLGLARGAGRDARLDHPAAGAALLPRAAGRPAADPDPRPPPRQGRRRRQIPRRPLEPLGAEAAVAGGDRRHRDPARPRGAGARHAARLPRRRQRPQGHDDPPGLRPDQRGLRPGRQRPARDRRRTPGSRRQGDGRTPWPPTCARTRASPTCRPSASTRTTPRRSSP